MSKTVLSRAAETASVHRPRLGFLGIAGMGRDRLRMIAHGDLAEVVAIADPAAPALRELDAVAPRAARLTSFEELLALPLDGIVIATPGPQYAAQTIRALESGIAVFCQKPLGRTGLETRRVIEAAKHADLLLGVDRPFRFMEAMRVLHAVVQAGELGDVYAVDLAFHDAHGPGRGWDRDPAHAAGCVLDLGSHVVDLALWTLGFPRVTRVSSRRYARGELLPPGSAAAEDYATALLELDTGATVRLACSWDLPSGRDVQVDVSFFGTAGGGSFRNVNGSWYDFTAELYRGTSRHTLADPPDAWGGRAATEWVRRLAAGERYDPWIEGLIDVATTIDAVMGR